MQPTCVMQPKRILLPTDFSECANAALDHALILAQRFDADLHLLHVAIEEESLSEDEPLDTQDLMDQIELSALARHLLSETGELRVHEERVEAFDVASTIVGFGTRHNIDLMVLGTHGRRGLSHFLLGSVAEKVVRTAHCPVLVCRQPPKDLQTYDRILVPYDFSADSNAALSTAISLADTFGGRIEMLHVTVPPVPIGGEVGMPAMSPPIAELQEQAEHALQQRIDGLDASISITPRVIEGAPAWSITEHCEENTTNLVVMGSHGLTGLRRWLLGSVSERVVRTAPCPVLVLQHREEASQAGAA